MNSTILAFLTRDALTTGAIYALLGVAFVLVFAVTRVIFIPQGEFVAFGALSMVALEQGRVPGTVGLLLITAMVAAVSRCVRERSSFSLRRGLQIGIVELAPALVICGVVIIVAPRNCGLSVSIALTIAITVLIGVGLYRGVFEPLQRGSVLVLMIAAFGVHFVLLGLGLHFFGPEGFRSTPVTEMTMKLGPLSIKLQDVIVLITCVVLMAALWMFFARTVPGKVLRASAVNRVGASLVGIQTAQTGQTAFAMAAGIGAISGILIGPVTTVYFDTGFGIGLKGLIAAVLGGLVSYPLTVAAALMIAFIESFSAFWASAYKEVIVFLVTLPVLLWLSLNSSESDDHDD